jgi:hypothetical protein
MLGESYTVFHDPITKKHFDNVVRVCRVLTRRADWFGENLPAYDCEVLYPDGEKYRRTIDPRDKIDGKIFRDIYAGKQR